jgi:hypothetical protein
VHRENPQHRASVPSSWLWQMTRSHVVTNRWVKKKGEVTWGNIYITKSQSHFIDSGAVYKLSPRIARWVVAEHITPSLYFYAVLLYSRCLNFKMISGDTLVLPINTIKLSLLHFFICLCVITYQLLSLSDYRSNCKLLNCLCANTYHILSGL